MMNETARSTAISGRLRYLPISSWICLLLSAVVASAAASHRPPFSFQLHSFNDLRKLTNCRAGATHSCCALCSVLTRPFQENGLSCCPKPPPHFVPPCSSK